MRTILLAIALWLTCVGPSLTQNTIPPDQPFTLTARSTLVLVPTLVKSKAGELVYTLTANDFTLTDDGVEQKLTLEADNGADPLALVIVAQIGGQPGASGAEQLDKYRGLATSLESLIGNVPHRVAVVAFDTVPSLEQPFTEDIAKAAATLGNLDQGNTGSAILDALGFAVDLLRQQPSQYRRAILLLSETVDHGSKLSFDDAVRQLSDTILPSTASLSPPQKLASAMRPPSSTTPTPAPRKAASAPTLMTPTCRPTPRSTASLKSGTASASLPHPSELSRWPRSSARTGCAATSPKP